MHKNILDILRDNSHTHANKYALEDDENKVSWKELNDITDRVAARLTELRCKKGHNIGIYGKNSIEWVEIFIGVMKFGGIPVLLNTHLKCSELEKIIVQCDIETVLIDQKMEYEKSRELINIKCIQILYFQEIMDYYKNSLILNCITKNILQGDTACIILTSGSTSIPKAVMLSYENIVSNAVSIVKALHWNESDKMCLCVPMFHCFGLTAGLLSGIVSKCTIYILKEFKTVNVYDALVNKKCNLLSGVPSLFMLFHKKYFDQKFDKMKSGIIAGSTILPEEYYKITDIFPGMKLLPSYGQSETSPCVTVADWDSDINKIAFNVGKVIENVEVKIDHNGFYDNSSCKIVGEILVKGINVMKGYYNNDYENNKVFTSDGWLRTGDLGYFDEENNLHIRERKKDIIIRFGENISPIEIEELVYKINGIKKAKVCGIPAKIIQEEVVLCIVADEEITDDYIIGYLKKFLADYKIPSKIFRFDDFKMTANGKIDIFALKKEISDIMNYFAFR